MIEETSDVRFIPRRVEEFGVHICNRSGTFGAGPEQADALALPVRPNCRSCARSLQRFALLRLRIGRSQIQGLDGEHGGVAGHGARDRGCHIGKDHARLRMGAFRLRR